MKMKQINITIGKMFQNEKKIINYYLLSLNKNKKYIEKELKKFFQILSHQMF